jgi:hypothetical protein
MSYEDMSNNYANVALGIRNIAVIGGIACLTISHQMEYAPRSMQKMFYAIGVIQFFIAAQAEIGWLAARIENPTENWE